MAREDAAATAIRMRKLLLLQEHYVSFVVFLQDAMRFLGFPTSEIQEDIANYLQYGPVWLMVQAQRRQAKTTITAIFAVWYLIHHPKGLVLVVSAGSGLASDISTLIVRIIMNMGILECMRPDRNEGDRSSTEGFDVHYSLKGVDKSPSVSCMGIKANLPGHRADLLIADDVESPKLTNTALARAALAEEVKEFAAIAGPGRIVWLGTPQVTESIYNLLPARGVAVRIWPGRYPDETLVKHYGDRLAPIVATRLKADPSLATGHGLFGDRGAPVDPQLAGEELLRAKEMNGAAYFNLQYMLSTMLSDRERYPIKLDQCLTMDLRNDRLPMAVVRAYTDSGSKRFVVGDFEFSMAVPHSVSEATGLPDSTVMTIDPAPGGANGDGSGWAVTSFLNGNIFIRDWGSVPGGYHVSRMEALAGHAIKNRVKAVVIEKNMGYGAFREIFIPVLRRLCDAANDGKGLGYSIGVEDDYVTGQKELRICSTIEPIVGRGSLIFCSYRMAHENEALSAFDRQKAKLHSLPFQLAHITRTRGALVHDDTLDAVEAGCRRFQKSLATDQEHAVEAAREAELVAWLKNPLGHPGQSKQVGNNAISRSRANSRFRRK